MGKVNGKKSSQVTYRLRIGIVTEMLLEGRTERDIVRYAAELDKMTGKKRWEVTTRQIENYISVATKEMHAQFEPERISLINDMYVKYKYLHRVMMAKKDYKGASSILDKITALTGIAAPSKHDHTTNGESINVQWVINANDTTKD